MAIAQATNILSLAEFLVLPETKPATELIDGQIYQKPMPQGKHSRLQTKFAAQINDLYESKQLASAFCELRCSFSGSSIVPDIVIFEWANIPLDQQGEPANKILIPPDWLIEILSPDQSPILVIEKLDFAVKHGSKLGWLIAPEEKRILTFQQERFAYHYASDRLPVLDVLGDWRLTGQDVFDLIKYR